MGESCVGKKLWVHVPPALNRQLHIQQFSLFQSNFSYSVFSKAISIITYKWLDETVVEEEGSMEDK